MFNENFKPRCLGDNYLLQEAVVYIADAKVYNDSHGEYVNLRGGSHVNGGYAYLDEIDLEFPVSDTPLYYYEKST